jgi:heparanase
LLDDARDLGAANLELVILGCEGEAMELGVSNVRFLRVLLVGALMTMLADVLPAQENSGAKVNPSTMPKVATVDARFLSFNVEMVEVTGGRFWAPYKSNASAKGPTTAPPVANQPVGGMSSTYEYRPPIDLASTRLRKLAAALAPSYMRVSGTWQNSTYFQNDDESILKDPPPGYGDVLSRAEWKGVVDFARAVDAGLVTSVSVSIGTRDANGAWLPDQAKAVMEYTKSAGGSIAATEFMNEPTFPTVGTAAYKSYDAAGYARDLKIFEPLLREEFPKAIFLGPGGVSLGGTLPPAGAQSRMGGMTVDSLMIASGPIYDAYSYHFYGAISARCGGKTSIAQALTAGYLDETIAAEAENAAFRDKYLPGKPIWLTETGEAACGGDQLASQFVDSFRFLNQLAALAQKGVQVVIHNTLAASDYGLIKEGTFDPRPNYWAAVVWKRTMGTVVLDPEVMNPSGLKVYAQCMIGHKGGVTVLAMNIDPAEEHALTIPKPADRYTLTAAELTSETLLLNGVALQAGNDGTVPEMKGEKVKAGTLPLAPASITFLTIPSAGNTNCM